MAILQSIFSFLPIIKLQVQGNSMLPMYKTGDMVLVNKFTYIFHSPEKDDIIVLMDPREKRFILKRIVKIAQKKYFVLGDNEKESTDSRAFGWITKEQIMGKVIYHLK